MGKCCIGSMRKDVCYLCEAFNLITPSLDLQGDISCSIVLMTKWSTIPIPLICCPSWVSLFKSWLYMANKIHSRKSYQLAKPGKDAIVYGCVWVQLLARAISGIGPLCHLVGFPKSSYITLLENMSMHNHQDYLNNMHSLKAYQVADRAAPTLSCSSSRLYLKTCFGVNFCIWNLE